MKFNIWLIIFALSSTCAILINKHVLWELRFTYPTIFQSWQMFVASFFLISFHLIGYVQLESLSKGALISWLPAVIFFTISIYSGSKGLARLPVPVFSIIQQKLTYFGLQLINVWRSNNKRCSLFHIVTITESIVFVFIIMTFNTELQLLDYKWLLIHCSSMFFYSFHALCLVKKPIADINKMTINSSASIVILLLFGYASGETITVFEFQYLYHGHFHLACVGSGVFGTFIMISYCHLCHHVTPSSVRYYNVFVMMFVSVISLFIFPATVLSSQLLGIIFIGFLLIVAELYYQLVYLETGVSSSVAGKDQLLRLPSPLDDSRFITQISMSLFSSPTTV